jgi:hypothetical protein
MKSRRNRNPQQQCEKPQPTKRRRKKGTTMKKREQVKQQRQSFRAFLSFENGVYLLKKLHNLNSGAG